jgi:uncharacterized protein YbaR (Trm112 family)
MKPYDRFVQKGLLMIAGCAGYPEGHENPYRKWRPTPGSLQALWNALSDEEQRAANELLDSWKEGGLYEVPKEVGDDCPVRVHLPPLTSFPHGDWRYWFKELVVCKVCKKFYAIVEELPVDCPTCDRTLGLS